MTSFIFPSIRREKSSSVKISSGPIFSNGFIAPCKTWYKPLYLEALSIAKRSSGCSTTIITPLSLIESEQIGQGSFSETFLQDEQRIVFLLRLDKASAKLSSSTCGT